MNIDTELREAYERLVESAPGRDSLDVPHDHLRHIAARRGSGIRMALTAAAVAAVVAASLVIARPWHDGRTSDDDKRASTANPLPYPSEYWFGPTSLPGYTISSMSLDPTVQTFSYVPEGSVGRNYTGTDGVLIRGFMATRADQAGLALLKSVTVGGKPGYYGTFASITSALASIRPSLRPSSIDPGFSPQPETGLVWEFAHGRWAVITKGQTWPAEKTNVVEQKLIHVASALTPKAGPNVALLKVGYLPDKFRFDYAGQSWRLVGASRGTRYRSLNFTGRSRAPGNATTLTISSFSESFKSYLTGSGEGPWTKTTIQGHPAYISPHKVLVRFGDVPIAIANWGEWPTTPMVSQQELLRIAGSLTVPSSVDYGHGYPLAAAIPRGAVR
jgi:hypothetical protein